MKKLPKTKVCTKCGKRKQRTKQYFEVCKRPKGDGLSSHCRVCRRGYYQRHFKKMYKDPSWRQKKIEITIKAMVKYRQKHVNG